MPAVLIRHRQQDFETWKAAFDDHESFRRAHGARSERVFRNADDPNETLVLLEWDDLDAARAFSQSPELREKMQEAGVTGPPEVVFLDDAA